MYLFKPSSTDSCEIRSISKQIIAEHYWVTIKVAGDEYGITSTLKRGKNQIHSQRKIPLILFFRFRLALDRSKKRRPGVVFFIRCRKNPSAQ